MRLTLFLLLFLLSLPNLTLAASPKLLFDHGHGQAFTIEKDGELQLSGFAESLRNDGWQVAAASAPLTRELLNNVNALIISGAFKPLSANELEAIGDFLRNGGRLVVLLHIAPPLVPLLAKLGVSVANGVVREWDRTLIIDEQPLYFRVAYLEEHPLTKGLKTFSMYGGWPLLPLQKNVHAVASTTPMAWVDLDWDEALTGKDAIQEFAVLVAGSVGKGEFVVFSDDAIFQNRFLQGENEKLLENLSGWMMQGKAQHGTDN